MIQVCALSSLARRMSTSRADFFRLFHFSPSMLPIYKQQTINKKKCHLGHEQEGLCQAPWLPVRHRCIDQSRKEITMKERGLVTIGLDDYECVSIMVRVQLYISTTEQALPGCVICR